MGIYKSPALCYNKNNLGGLKNMQTEEVRNERMQREAERYNDLVNTLNMEKAELIAKNREVVKANTYPIYKHYLKQGAKYALCGALVALGGVLVLSPASIPFLAGVSALVTTPIGAGAIAGGIMGGIVTRLNRSLEFNARHDAKRIKFFWSESKRLRKIEKSLEKMKALLATNPQRANYYRQKAQQEIRAYEKTAFQFYREVNRDLKTRTSKYGKEGNLGRRFLFWTGVNHFDDVEDLRISQLYHMKDWSLMQLKNADYLREEAGLAQNENTVELFKNIREDCERLSKETSEEIIKNITDRKDLERCETDKAFKEAIERMLTSDRLSDEEFESRFAKYGTIYNLTAEQVFNECLEHNFGRRPVAATLQTILGNLEINEFSEEGKAKLVEKYEELEDEDKESIFETLTERANKAKGKSRERINSLQEALLPAGAF